MLFWPSVRHLRRALAGDDANVPLDLAALELASIEYPGLDPAPYLGLLDSYAAEIATRLAPADAAPAFVERLNHYLFDELGFAGNTGDYYNPRNSCLNEVLVLRTGIPITLSLVYMEVARRLGRTVLGIGLPGHFIVRVEQGAYSAFVDPFHSGRLLTPEACFEIAREVTGVDFSADPAVLEPVGNRHMLLRMLNNLRVVYMNGGQDEKAIRVLDLLIEAQPSSADEYRLRGFLLIRAKRLRPALADLLQYLRLAPDAADKPRVQRYVDALRSRITSLN